MDPIISIPMYKAIGISIMCILEGGTDEAVRSLIVVRILILQVFDIIPRRVTRCTDFI